MVKIASIIITYKRDENIPRVIEGIRSQTVPSEIWVWGNRKHGFSVPTADVLINSTRNFYCQPRFLIAGFVKTPYIFNQDDDLAIKDKYLFAKLIETSKQYPNDFIGWNGRKFDDRVNWEKAYSFPGRGFCDDTDMDGLDMLNVGVSFFPTRLVNQIKINPFVDGITEEQMKYGDDMIISSQLKNKRITSYMRKAFEYLNEYEERGAALSKQTQHMNVRDEMCRKYWRK